MANLLTRADAAAASGARLPDTFLVGAMKAGTTAVADALAAHPEVFVCPVKEPHALADPAWIGPDRAARGVHPATAVLRRGGPDRLHHAAVGDAATYAALFRGAAGYGAVVDATTSYLPSPGTPWTIAEARPAARILILLRDPIGRAVAHHRMDRRIGRERRSLARAVAADGAASPYIAHGRYAEPVRRYLDAFPRERVLILTHDALSADFAGCMRTIAAHLGIAPEAIGEPVGSAGADARWPVLTAALHRSGVKSALARTLPHPARALGRRVLETRYGASEPSDADRAAVWPRVADDVAALEALLGWDLSHWRPPANTPAPR